MSRYRRTLAHRPRALGLALGATLAFSLVAACGSSGGAAPPARPATVESVAGSSSVRVHLTADAAHRIDLQTATLKLQAVAGRPQLAALGRAPTVTPAPTVTAAPAPTPAAPAPATTTTAVALAPGDTEPPKNGATTVAAAPTTAATAPAPTPAPTTTAPPPRLTVPAAAVLYRPSGEAFVYVVAGTLEYERRAVVVDYVIADLAVLTSGPAAGTSVVTVGAAELLGAELGVGGAELG